MISLLWIIENIIFYHENNDPNWSLKKKKTQLIGSELTLGCVFYTPLHHRQSQLCCAAVCGAPKRRFRAYEPAVKKNANEYEARKARKAQIQRDEAIG